MAGPVCHTSEWTLQERIIANFLATASAATRRDREAFAIPAPRGTNVVLQQRPAIRAILPQSRSLPLPNKARTESRTSGGEVTAPAGGAWRPPRRAIRLCLRLGFLWRIGVVTSRGLTVEELEAQTGAAICRPK